MSEYFHVHARRYGDDFVTPGRATNKHDDGFWCGRLRLAVAVTTFAFQCLWIRVCSTY